MSAVTIPTVVEAVRTVLDGKSPDYSAVNGNAEAGSTATALLSRILDLLDITDLVHDQAAFADVATGTYRFFDDTADAQTFTLVAAEFLELLGLSIDDAKLLGHVTGEPTAAVLRSQRIVFINDDGDSQFSFLDLDPQSAGGVSFYGVNAQEAIEIPLIALTTAAARLVHYAVADGDYDNADDVFAEFN